MRKEWRVNNDLNSNAEIIGSHERHDSVVKRKHISQIVQDILDKV